MDKFFSLYHHNMARVAACTFPVRLADPAYNTSQIERLAARCEAEGAVLAVFPELSVTGYALDDLRQQDILLRESQERLADLAVKSRAWSCLIVVGCALRRHAHLYNCAIVIHGGEIKGVVPKSYLPNYREFYELRHFSSGRTERGGHIRIGDVAVPFGIDLLFTVPQIPDFVLGIEICEDLWVPSPPSTQHSLAGATIIANLSASNITIGKEKTRDLLCVSQSLRTMAAYVYAVAGCGESTTDCAWDGQIAIYESGRILQKSERFPRDPCLVLADIDFDLIRQDRLQTGSFAQCADAWRATPYREIACDIEIPTRDIGLKRIIARFPFVPDDASRIAEDCYEACMIQAHSLVQRVLASKASHLVLGISGGLDSTLALLVAARAADQLGWARTRIIGYTMPGFATSASSKNRASRLMSQLQIDSRELDIRATAMKMLEEIDHPYASGLSEHDVTFENVQAGLRTDFLFRIANQQNALVVGTGDLSEIALGWCTYGVGDHMSHYNVNAGVPKTLIQHVVRWYAGETEDPILASLLDDIVEQEITPELIPVGGGDVQRTEDIVGPYNLQDFNLFYTLRYGLRPSKIAFLAHHAWSIANDGAWPENFPSHLRVAYTLAEIKKWLEVFVTRFFGSSQFKRSAVPNGPKLSPGGGLSPRADWRAPSDGNATIWMDDVKNNVPYK